MLALALLLATTTHVAAQALPTATVDTTLPAVTGSSWSVAVGGDVQATINAAQLGDEIVLAAGATFQGPFTLPPKAGTGWITLRSSRSSELPAPGSRATSVH